MAVTDPMVTRLQPCGREAQRSDCPCKKAARISSDACDRSASSGISENPVVLFASLLVLVADGVGSLISCPCPGRRLARNVCLWAPPVWSPGALWIDAYTWVSPGSSEIVGTCEAVSRSGQAEGAGYVVRLHRRHQGRAGLADCSNLKRMDACPTCLNLLRVESPIGFGNSRTNQRSGEKTNGT